MATNPKSIGEAANSFKDLLKNSVAEATSGPKSWEISRQGLASDVEARQAYREEDKQLYFLPVVFASTRGKIPFVPQELEYQIQSMLKILEFATWMHMMLDHDNLEYTHTNHARECDRFQAVKALSNIWFEALECLISHDASENFLFSVYLLEVAVEKHLNEPGLLVKHPRMSSKERRRKAECLSRLLERLLLESMKRRCMALTDILSKRLVSTIRSVRDIEETGNEVMVRLIGIFSVRFTYAVNARNETDAGFYARKGLLLLKHAALHPDQILIDQLAIQFVSQWKLAIDFDMGQVVVSSINEEWEDYQWCYDPRLHDVPLRRAIVGLGLFRHAITMQNCDEVVETLHHIIIEAVRGSTHHVRHEQSDELSKRAIIEVCQLFHAASQDDLHPMADLAWLLLDTLGSISSKRLAVLKTLICQSLEYPWVGNRSNLAQSQLKQEIIFFTIDYLMSLARSAGDTTAGVQSILEDVAQSVASAA